MTGQPIQTQQRHVRVFVSSTFKDMHAERDELAKYIFPQLRKLCEQRGVTWGEVDLRWGITDEQRSEGKVLPICLDEIQRCRPYFIGLLGERYGWIPDEFPPELIEREPWLMEHVHQSVTELEILHGVLNNPGMAQNAFFYIRDPDYIERLPAEQQPAYREGPVGDEMEKLGPLEAQKKADARKEKLNVLKERLCNSKFPVKKNYRDARQLGEWVLQDLLKVIERLYPENSLPDALDQEAAGHENFALSRARVYIGRQTCFDQLDAHARGDGPPLVILGESGSGKSALLANWALQYRTEHPDDLVLMQFIGGTPGSTDWVVMLRRILGEFIRRFDIQEEIPDQPDALRSAFANWLNMASARGRVVLILDALNQLEDRDGAPDLVWLPPHIPENIRMLLSTLPGRALDDLNKRGWPSLSVEPLQTGERKQLIHEYLGLFTKALSPALTERIATADQCRNPLFLRVLLDELRLFGVHERLGERIETYLGALTIPALYQLILERCEQDYERERPGLVRETLSLLWAARRGLSEAELMDLLGKDGQPLPRAYWSPLYLALEQSFLSRGGLIGFAHDHVRQAVKNRYLPEAPLQKLAHLNLADYFEARSIDSTRRTDEYPWQLVQAREWQRLSTLLGNLEFFEASWKFNPFEVKNYWAQVEANSTHRSPAAYRQVIDHPDLHPDLVLDVSMLLSDTGYLSEALSLRAYLVDHYRKVGDLANLASSLGNQALILADRGDLDGAMALHKEEERICRELGHKAGLGRSLGSQALILSSRGDLDGAIAYHKEEELIFRELGDKAGLGRSLGNRAVLLNSRGDLDGGMVLHKEQERICRELGDKAGLRASLSNQALILYLRGDLDGSMTLHKEAERICRELGDKAGLGGSLGNQALIFKARGDLDGGLKLHKEQERICRELGDKAGLQASLGNQALILYDRGDLDGAMALHKEEERICRELGHKAGLGRSLGSQANILSDRHDQDGAMNLYKEQERICRELGDKVGLQASLGNQAIILKARNDLDGALALRKEEERICRELGNPESIAISLINQATLLGKMGRKVEAQRVAEESLGLAKKYGYGSLAQKIKTIHDKL